MEVAVSLHRAKLRRLLRIIRREREVTQVELAARTGMPQSLISKYETGERQLEFSEVLVLCEAMGMSPDGFWRRWNSAYEDWEGE